MMDAGLIEKLVGHTSFIRGQRLYNGGHVDYVEVTEDPMSGITQLDGYVKSSHWNTEYHVHIVLSSDGNWVLDSYCDCPFYDQNMKPCKHIAAVLLYYIDQDRYATIGNGFSKPKRTTDAEISDLLAAYTDSHADVMMLPSAPVRIVPYMTGYSRKEGSLKAEFRIGIPGSHMYVIQNIDNFCMTLKNNESKKYGKSLEFVHTMDAFEPACRPLINLLLSFYDREDSYTEASGGEYYNYYYSYQSASSMRRELTLRGRYLDAFMTAIENISIYVMEKNPYGGTVEELYTIVDQDPHLSATLRKDSEDNGYLLRLPSSEIFQGHTYNYLADHRRRMIMRFRRNDRMNPLLSFINQPDSDEERYIAEEDLPTFARYVFPVLNDNLVLNNEGFDPNDYVVPKPDFEIYLDLPQDDLITGELRAKYPEAVYDVQNPDDHADRRDLSEENLMNAIVSKHFTYLDPSTKKLSLTGTDDAIYTFIRESIPALQDLGTVFISDKLKRLTIRSMPKISVGVSVEHDLLQLDMVSNEMSLQDVADILSRYDRKKKFFRLKNGDFIDLDDSLEDLLNLTEKLDLSKKDILSGSVEIPRYRAMYLDQLAESTAFDLDRSTSFRNMIKTMKSTDGSQYDPPKDLRADLRSYQKDGFRWLCSLRDNGFGGLLADEMGLGKTLQVIAMLGSWKGRGRALVVCPASLVYNWNAEIMRFLPSMKSRMIQGTAAMRKEQILSSGEDEVLITSYDLLKRDIRHYEDLHFSCEIIDEAQYIKNAGTQASKAVKLINASFRIALTGTPIENRLSELWSIFDYLMPGFFHSYTTFREQFELPIVRDEDDLAERDLTAMITPFVLRRLKKDVLKDLPDKLEEVYYAPLEGEQKELYDARVQRLKLMLEGQSEKEFKENKIMVLSELTRLRQICCDPALIYEDYKSNSAKADMCIDMIKNAVEGGHKVLLFSQFTTMLDELCEKLAKEKIQYHLLKGSTKKSTRAELVEAFQHDDVPVFCISLKAGGTGLNLTAADIVIHYDPWWNTAVENQASDRAHRIGQQNVVSVYRLIMKDTIEERILALQEEKSDLAGRILSGDGISSSKLSREDLLALL